ncbi:isoaspartyl peptidase/L-asparaginase-like [Biomphalaria glabrata]|uniref:Isoaspartyl peptidase/L-asparaginase-like n=1 Tax=Biomphalaria glabrata TaxID=6526 RepID=A0A9W2ZYE5_BIOGL|nr:isoaspartyl peptidase/L-asparaginase-like [Biomphalaria glabrata]XP_055879949.1 isoaspartyl peptidase/L-asparaginase-like [Biomphalaria glabrata]
MEPAIIVHGGAWAIPELATERSLSGVKAAAIKGFSVIQNGGSALDAVVAAVSVMEDDTIFDAGHGAVLNMNGEVELDAIIMDGKTLNSGAVAAVQDIAHPVQLARLVMEKTDHCLLVGQGANGFAKEQNIPKLDKYELVTPEAREEWERYMKFSTTVNALFSTRNDVPKRTGCDTVGAVALDSYGNLASATSTGGITAKRPGRVGDTPIIGAGAYADDSVGAASSTGHGESIMKLCLTKKVIELLEQGASAKEAAQKSLELMSTRLGSAGGLIVIDKNGDVAHHFTTNRMAWAQIKKGNLKYGIDPTVEFTETLFQENSREI